MLKKKKPHPHASSLRSTNTNALLRTEGPISNKWPFLLVMPTTFCFSVIEFPKAVLLSSDSGRSCCLACHFLPEPTERTRAVSLPLGKSCLLVLHHLFYNKGWHETVRKHDINLTSKGLKLFYLVFVM